MATLTGNTVQSTYKSLIKINDNSELNATTPESLTDGFGNAMPLQVSQNQIKFTGILDADSATSILGFDAPKNIIIDGVGTWTADQVEDTVTFAGGDNVTIGLAGDTITWSVATSSLAGYATEAYVLSQTASLSASLATDIATNAGNIATNTSNISTNASDILDLEAGVGNVITINGLAGTPTIAAGTDISVGVNPVTSTITINNTMDTGSLLDDASGDFSILTFTNGDGTTFEVDATPRKVIESVKNAESFTLAKGTPVYVSGSTGNASNVYQADADDASKMPAAYVLDQQLTAGQEGFGILAGFITGVDTSTFTSGDSVYVAGGGGYTNVKPTGSALIQKLGNVIDSAVNGSGVITGAGRSNDLPNIQSGYAWVGDADGVPQAVSTSSFASTPLTISNNTDGNLLTATGLSDEITGENSLRWLSPAELSVSGSLTVQDGYNVVYQKNLNDINAGTYTTSYKGDVIELGTDSTTAGNLYYYDGANWQLADADVEAAAQSLLAIAISNSSGKGMLINGWYKDGAVVANGQVYMSATAGDITTTQPSTTGQFVRVIGHGIGLGFYRFNPSNDYFEVE